MFPNQNFPHTVPNTRHPLFSWLGQRGCGNMTDWSQTEDPCSFDHFSPWAKTRMEVFIENVTPLLGATENKTSSWSEIALESVLEPKQLAMKIDTRKWNLCSLQTAIGIGPTRPPRKECTTINIEIVAAPQHSTMFRYGSIAINLECSR